MRRIRIYILSVFFILPGLAHAQKVSLNGAWDFSLDPLRLGEKEGWTATEFHDRSLDKVTVPHCYSTDPRFFFHTGTAWYFKKFDAPVIKAGYRSFIRFEAVFYKTRIWLNGKQAGSHEGGYTPFEVEVTDLLQAKNKLAVEVDNSWDSTTIPGAKTRDGEYRPNASQLYPWINYGGITKPVQLIVRPAVYLQHVQLMATPDLQKGTARVRVKAIIKQTATPALPPVKVAVFNPLSGEKYGLDFKPLSQEKREEGLVSILEATIPARQVRLWTFDDPQLYKAVISIDGDTVNSSFGIRKMEVKGTQLLLNGKAVKLGGANRPTDYPGVGSIDPDSVVAKDLTLMKNGGMEFSRIAHHAASSNVLDWADKHGMLIVTEAGNWQMTPKQMADPVLREKYKSQLKEMVERDWNHPSVIAYSLGNEFYSQTPEGKAWVRDMMAYVKTLDSTRLITFASYMVWRDWVSKPEDEASQYVDFISANIYGDHLKLLRHLHDVYPDKPIFISEFGKRVNPKKPEQERVDYLKWAMEDIRKCDWVAGASVWTFNDYLSRYPETDADGYRGWGLVNAQRQPRGMYYKWQEEFSPATIELVSKQNGKAIVRLTARKDFPSYSLINYSISCNGRHTAVPTLHPGESREISLSVTDEEALNISLIKPGGFTILNKTY